MVIVMEMDSGRKCSNPVLDCYGEVYGDEVLNAGWTDLPQVELGLQTHEAATHGALPADDIEGFLARLYASQE